MRNFVSPPILAHFLARMDDFLKERVAHYELLDPMVIMSPPRDELCLWICNAAILIQDALTSRGGFQETLQYVERILARVKGSHLLHPSGPISFTTYVLPFSDIAKHPEDIAFKTTVYEDKQTEFDYVPGGVYIIFSTVSNIFSSATKTPSSTLQGKIGTVKFYILDSATDKYSGMLYKLEDTDYNQPPFVYDKEPPSKFCLTCSMLVLNDNTSQDILKIGLNRKAKRDGDRVKNSQRLKEVQAECHSSTEMMRDSLISSNKLVYKRAASNLTSERALYIEKLQMHNIASVHSFLKKFSGTWTLNSGEAEFVIGASAFLDLHDAPSGFLGTSASSKYAYIIRVVTAYESRYVVKIVPIGIETNTGACVCLAASAKQGEKNLICVLFSDTDHVYTWSCFAAMLDDIAEDGLGDMPDMGDD